MPEKADEQQIITLVGCYNHFIEQTAFEVQFPFNLLSKHYLSPMEVYRALEKNAALLDYTSTASARFYEDRLIGSDINNDKLNQVFWKFFSNFAIDYVVYYFSQVIKVEKKFFEILGALRYAIEKFKHIQIAEDSLSTFHAFIQKNSFGKLRQSKDDSCESIEEGSRANWGVQYLPIRDEITKFIEKVQASIVCGGDAFHFRRMHLQVENKQLALIADTEITPELIQKLDKFIEQDFKSDNEFIFYSKKNGISCVSIGSLNLSKFNFSREMFFEEGSSDESGFLSYNSKNEKPMFHTYRARCDATNRLNLLVGTLDKVVKNIDAASSEETVLGELAFLHYTMINTACYNRGTAAITEWLIRGLAKKQGLILNGFHNQGISPDFYAMLMPSPNFYTAIAFLSFFKKVDELPYLRTNPVLLSGPSPLCEVGDEKLRLIRTICVTQEESLKNIFSVALRDPAYLQDYTFTIFDCLGFNIDELQTISKILQGACFPALDDKLSGILKKSHAILLALMIDKANVTIDEALLLALIELAKEGDFKSFPTQWHREIVFEHVLKHRVLVNISLTAQVKILQTVLMCSSQDCVIDYILQLNQVSSLEKFGCLLQNSYIGAASKNYFLSKLVFFAEYSDKAHVQFLEIDQMQSSYEKPDLSTKTDKIYSFSFKAFLFLKWLSLRSDDLTALLDFNNIYFPARENDDATDFDYGFAPFASANTLDDESEPPLEGELEPPIAVRSPSITTLLEEPLVACSSEELVSRENDVAGRIDSLQSVFPESCFYSDFLWPYEKGDVESVFKNLKALQPKVEALLQPDVSLDFTYFLDYLESCVSKKVAISSVDLARLFARDRMKDVASASPTLGSPMTLFSAPPLRGHQQLSPLDKTASQKPRVT